MKEGMRPPLPTHVRESSSAEQAKGLAKARGFTSVEMKSVPPISHDPVLFDFSAYGPERATQLSELVGAVENPFGHKENLDRLMDVYGLDVADLSDAELIKIGTLFEALDHAREEEIGVDVAEQFEMLMREELIAQSYNKIDRLTADLMQLKSVDELKGGLRAVMESMRGLAEHVTFETEREQGTWKRLHDQFQQLVALKKVANEPTVSQVFSDVFQEFSDFIDDEFVAAYIEQERRSSRKVLPDKALQQVYGRSPEEMGRIKNENRKAVVEELDNNRELTSIDIDLLEEFHRLNNRGIVPKDVSRIRSGEDWTAYYKRIGVRPEDLQLELTALFEEFNGFLEKDSAKPVSDLEYGVRVARLHNAIVDIHPFVDRNGSTALILVELLMMKRGYTPSESRPASESSLAPYLPDSARDIDRHLSYYEHLLDVFGRNPIPVAVIGGEMLKMKHVSGYYKRAADVSGEVDEQYQRVLEMLRRQKAARQQAA